MREIGIGEVVRRGALHGIEAWAAYAVAEGLFSSVLPWALPLVGGYYITNDDFTLFVTAVYLVFGALSGAAAGLLLRFAGRSLPRFGRFTADRLLRAATALGVALALVFNFVFYARSPGPIALAAVWAVLILLSTGSSRWARRLAAFANPWPACFVLLGSQWLDKGSMLDWPQWQVAMAYSVCAAAVLVAAAGQWWFGRRRPFRWAASALALVLVASFAFDETVQTAAAAAPALPPGDRPNVILITLDTVRADHLSLYGYARPTTPSLEQLARDSVVYSDAISASDMTLSAHASIFTGLYPSHHGAHTTTERYWGTPLAPSLPSLPELLSQQGYRTSAIVANYAYLAPAFGFGRGFERYDARMAVLFLTPSRNAYLRTRLRNFMTRFVPPAEFEREARSAAEINRRVFATLDERHRDRRPFFLFINYMDAHWPYLPPAPYDVLYPGKAKRFTGPKYYSLQSDLLTSDRKMTGAERDHLISQYDGALNYLDAELGKLVARLKQTGLYDNTLLVITSDHGEAMGNRSIVGHGLSVYQDEVHIPLLIKLPRGHKVIPEGTRVRGPVSSVDLLPTVLDTLGLSSIAGLDGRSLLARQGDASRTIFAESFPLYYLKTTRVERAVFSDSLKLIRSTQGKRELYDLARDPGENRSVYASSGPAARRLEDTLVKWEEAIPGRAQAVPKLEHGTVEKLRSLGYVQ
ncbi:MAG TPA: sulfatase [Bryobacteraceae bacterium]